MAANGLDIFEIDPVLTIVALIDVGFSVVLVNEYFHRILLPCIGIGIAQIAV
ncbi:hypothetical protein D3C85_1859360 [compost metagenome]